MPDGTGWNWMELAATGSWLGFFFSQRVRWGQRSSGYWSHCHMSHYFGGCVFPDLCELKHERKMHNGRGNKRNRCYQTGWKLWKQVSHETKGWCASWWNYEALLSMIAMVCYCKCPKSALIMNQMLSKLYYYKRNSLRNSLRNPKSHTLFHYRTLSFIKWSLLPASDSWSSWFNHPKHTAFLWIRYISLCVCW